MPATNDTNPRADLLDNISNAWDRLNRLAQGIQVAQAAQITEVAANLEEARQTMGTLMNRLLREQAAKTIPQHADTTE